MLFRSVGRGNEQWDPLSLRHQTIDEGRDPFWDFDPVADAARDVLTWLLSNDTAHAEHLIREWISSEVPLLKRLAVYGLLKHSSLNSDQRLEFILSYNLIYRLSPDSEVRHLLESEYQGASVETRERIVAGLMQTPDGLDEMDSARLSYAMLSGLARRQSACLILQRRLGEILALHPEFASPEERRIPVDWYNPAGAASISHPGEVLKLLEKNPEEHLQELLTYVGER